MEVSKISSHDTMINPAAPRPAVMREVKPDAAAGAKTADQQNGQEQAGKEQIGKVELSVLTEATNKFLQSMNADLHFKIHEETNRLQVQIVDSKEQRVLKEFPPKEFLDVIARIREYVGTLLDKRV